MSFLSVIGAILAVTFSANAQYACTRILSEIDDAWEMGSSLEWTYSKSSDTLAGRLALTARFGWVGIGFRNASDYGTAPSMSMKDTSFIIGFLYNDSGVEAPCVQTYYGAVSSTTGLAYPSREPLPAHQISNTSLARRDHEHVFMTFTVKPSTIPFFQEAGGKVLVALQYQFDPKDINTCPPTSTIGMHRVKTRTATSANAPFPSAAGKKPPMAVIHGHNWMRENENDCSVVLPLIPTNTNGPGPVAPTGTTSPTNNETYPNQGWGREHSGPLGWVAIVLVTLLAIALFVLGLFVRQYRISRSGGWRYSRPSDDSQPSVILESDEMSAASKID